MVYIYTTIMVKATRFKKKNVNKPIHQFDMLTIHMYFYISNLKHTLYNTLVFGSTLLLKFMMKNKISIFIIYIVKLYVYTI